MKRWCSRRLECGCCRARAPCATKEVPRDMGSTGSAVIFVFLGQGVAGGSVSVGTISLCFMSCHKKKGKGSKMRGGERHRKKKEKKQTKKSRVNLLASPDYAAPLVISVGYGVVRVSCKDRCKSVLSFHPSSIFSPEGLPFIAENKQINPAIALTRKGHEKTPHAAG